MRNVDPLIGLQLVGDDLFAQGLLHLLCQRHPIEPV
jgi:hypothetical protein